MKVISLLQPWATLVVIGAKTIETRSWDTKHRGDLLVHASRKFTKEQQQLCSSEPFYSVLKKLPYFDHTIHTCGLPTGAIIGKANVMGTSTTEFYKDCSRGIPLRKRYSLKDWEQEFAFGDYSRGRFGWLLSDPVQFANLTPIKGSLSLWDFDDRICLKCGCTEYNCSACVEKSGKPCYWIGENLCSACK